LRGTWLTAALARETTDYRASLIAHFNLGVVVIRHARRESARRTQNNGAKSEIIKYITAVTPYVRATVLAKTFVVKAIYCRYLARLVIATDQCHAVWISDFEAEEEEE
jgi:hypothetical protein